MNDNRKFIRIFWSYTMIVILPVFVLGFITVGILFGNLAKDTEKINMSIIEQSANVMDSDVKNTFSIFFRLEESDKVQSFIRGQQYGVEANKYDLYDVINEFRMFSVDGTITSKIGMYIAATDQIITDKSAMKLNEFYDADFGGDNFDCAALRESMSNGGMKSYIMVHKNRDNNDVVMCYKSLNVGGNLSCATVFAIWDADVIASRVRLDGEKEYDFAMVDANNQIIVQTADFEPEYRYQELVDGKNIIDIKSEFIDCRYVYSLADGGLSGNVRYIMLIFLLLTLITIVICIVLAFFHVKRMKVILLGVFKESKGLEDSLSEQLKNAKERILSNLLHNIRTEAFNTADIPGKYGINFGDKYFAVMTVSDAQNDNSDIYSSMEEAAWNELNNILRAKIVDMHMNCEVVRTGSNAYSYILNYDKPGTIAVLRLLPQEVTVNYGISINFGIGDETDNIDKIYMSYEGSVSALRFGVVERPGEAVYYEEIHNLENAKIYYTGEKEKQLIRSIKTGSQENVEEILNEIYKVNFRERRISHNNLKRLIFNMSLTIYKILDEAYENDETKHENYDRVCQNLYRNDNVEECYSILKEICLSLSDGIGKKTGEDVIKKQIVEYIANNYSNDSLSLEVLAEHLEISYHYLSRLFKEHLGTNFVSYLTLVRLEKAKELLKTTKHTIEYIAEQTGFVSSNSLIRAFKKYYDITPGKFRKG